MTSRKRCLGFALLPAVIALFSSLTRLVAQVNLGSIQGIVQDTQNAAIPGARIVLNNRCRASEHFASQTEDCV